MVLRGAKFCAIQMIVNSITGGGGSMVAALYFAGQNLLKGDSIIGDLYD